MFTITSHGGSKVKVAGCGVLKGKVKRGDEINIRRSDETLFHGSSLYILFYIFVSSLPPSVGGEVKKVNEVNIR